MSTIAIHPTAYARPRAARPAAPAVRLTRRGRIVLTTLFLALVLAAFTAYGARSVATGDHGTPVPTRTVVVSEGDTLWEIAGSVAAPGQVREMVQRIVDLNALSGVTVFEGQELAVPIK